jgi:amino acid permease
MSIIDVTHFAFPQVTEEQLRAGRLRAFWVSTVVSFGPYLVGLLFRFIFSTPLPDLMIQGIPDMSLAGSVVIIAACTNTVFGFPRLEGWKGIGTLTFFFAMCLAIIACMLFTIYLQAAYGVAPKDKERLFYAALLFTISACFFSWVLQHSFLRDERKSATEARRRVRKDRPP